MKNGYQKFFKDARDAKGPAPKTFQRPKGTAPKFAKPQQTSTGMTAAQEELRLRKAMKMRKARQPFPLRSVIGLAVTLGALGFYLAAPDVFEDLGSRIQVGAFGEASAADKKAAEKPKAAPAGEKSAEKGASDKPSAGSGEIPVSAADLGHFEKLKQRKEELDQREKELGELEEELQRQKVELDKRIVQLEEMRTSIGQVLKDRVEVDQEKVNKLVDLYSNMKPKQAADILGSLNEDLAVEVLAKMKKKNAAEVMNLLPSEKARLLSEKYTGYRRARGLAAE